MVILLEGWGEGVANVKLVDVYDHGAQCWIIYHDAVLLWPV